MKLYYSVSEDEYNSLTECGKKLNDYYDKIIFLNGTERKFFMARLHPADYEDKQKRIVKLILNEDIVYVAEGAFYNCGLDDLYQKSVIKYSSYVLGMYRDPECLFSSTILPQEIEGYDSRRDEPLLYGCSSELYVNRLLNEARDAESSFDEIILAAYYNIKAEKDGLSVKKGKDNKVFFDKEGKYIASVYNI
ncbi:MAG: hypothetical protein LBI03_00845 [Clostridiales bacterium]|jgi:hypothetical protein|nr:hypothetical protein [Clostridiales bacterium]